MASLFKRTYKSGNWTWMIQYVDSHGKTRSKSIGKVSKTRAKQVKSAVESKLDNKKLDEFLAGGKSTITPLTLTEFENKVIATKKHEVEYSTIQTYENAFNKMTEYFDQTKYTDSFTRIDIIEFRNYLLEKDLAKATVNKIHRVLDAAFQCGVDTLKCAESNPFKKGGDNDKKLKQLKENKKSPPIMPPKHIITFFDAFQIEFPDEFRDYLYFLTMYSIGCRPGELASITWQDVNLKDKIPHIIFRSETTKGKKENPVPLTEDLIAHFRRLKEIFGNDDRVFQQIRTTDRSHPAKIYRSYLKRVNLHEEKVGVNYTPYWLRHTLGSTSNSPIQDISALYNHSDVKVTQKYSHRQQLQTKLRVVQQYPSLSDLKRAEKTKVDAEKGE